MNIGYFVNGYTYEFNLYVKMFTFECSFQKYKAFLRAMRFVTFHQFVHSELLSKDKKGVAKVAENKTQMQKLMEDVEKLKETDGIKKF